MSAKDWVTPAVAAMHAYPVAQLPQNALRLSDMECPQDIDPTLRQAWLERLDKVAMNRYPRPGDDQIDAHLRRLFDVPDACPLIYGNGSDELIQIILMAVAQPGRTVLAPAPTFVMYQVCAEMLGMNYVGVPLSTPDFALNEQAMLKAIVEHQPAVIFLADPNNPTGNALDSDAVRNIIEAAPGLVVLDEAYGAYASHSNATMAQAYDNVVVIRTLSKIGYAGLRFGYAFGADDWIDAFAKVKPPYNINVLTLASVDFALEHDDFIRAQTAMICRERTRMLSAYQMLEGIEVWPSAANFLLLRIANAAKIYAALIEQNIWVKKLDGVHPLLRDCLRVTISNAEDNDRCFAAIKMFLEA
ncbi:histidinol-phosphate transaminase [Cardiobacteriaceae bacterium TAE3-ERU3]|nr:histidinol-phosphate transaminase [Cardiobacteriaceae bacterium TAE3-ERU3]